MPQQLIYTSAPQGVDVGRSGYCTVARSSTMGESLVQRLEQFSYYERLSEHGGEAERTVFIFRNIDIRGKAYHVLSRIKDAPADYTGRTNFIAQHLVFTPDEVAKMPTPAVILRRWSGWKDHWEQEPRLFESESWAELDELQKRTFLPAKLWYRETGDYGRAAGLIGLNSGAFAAQDFSPATILDLLSEALELLQLEGPNWRALAWQRTFSVGCQPQDNSADFRWRFLTSGLQFELAVTQGRTPQELRTLRAVSHSRQVQFATEGPVTPHFTLLPKAGEAVQRNEGETLILECAAESLPGKITYRWYSVGKDNTTGEELNEVYGAHTEKLTIPKIGRGKHRYKVIAWDSVTAAGIESHVIVVEVKERLSLSGRPLTSSSAVAPLRQAARVPKPLQVEKTPEPTVQAREYTPSYDLEPDIPLSFLSRHSNKVFAIGVAFLLIVCAAFFLKDSERGQRLRTTFLKALKQLTPNADPTTQPLGDANKPVKSNSKTNIEGQNPVGKPSKGSENNVTHPLHAILAESDWSKLLKPITDELKRVEQSEHKAAEALKAAGTKQKQATIEAEKSKGDPKKSTTDHAELKKADDQQARAEKDFKREHDQLESLKQKEKLLVNRKITANQFQFPKDWPYFTQSNPPTLHWVSLGKPASERKKVDGKGGNNDWTFDEAGIWSLQISKTGVVYQPTRQPGAISVEFSKPEDTAEPSNALGLLLFSPNTNLSFSAKVVGDSLVVSDELRRFLGGLVLHKSHSIRLVANYPPFKPSTNSLEEVYRMVSNPPWKLMITEQLAKQVTQLEKLKATRNALNRLDKLWEEVKQKTGKALLEATFSEAVDASSPETTDSQNRTRMERQFWHAFNRLVKVAVFLKNDANKPRQLQDMTSDEAHKQLDVYFSQKDADEYFKDKMKPLIADLDNVKRLWIGESSEFHKSVKHFSEVGSNLDAAIEKLRAGEGKIDSAKLRVDLQFQASETTWLTITRLDCR